MGGGLVENGTRCSRTGTRLWNLLAQEDGQKVELVRLADVAATLADAARCLRREVLALMADALDDQKGWPLYLTFSGDRYAERVTQATVLRKGVAEVPGRWAAPSEYAFSRGSHWDQSDDPEWLQGTPGVPEQRGRSGAAAMLRRVVALRVTDPDAWMSNPRKLEACFAVRAADVASLQASMGLADAPAPVVLLEVAQADTRGARATKARAEFKPKHAVGDRWTPEALEELRRQYDYLTGSGLGKLRAKEAYDLLGELWGYAANSIKTYLEKTGKPKPKPKRRLSAA